MVTETLFSSSLPIASRSLIPIIRYSPKRMDTSITIVIQTTRKTILFDLAFLRLRLFARRCLFLTERLSDGYSFRLSSPLDMSVTFSSSELSPKTAPSLSELCEELVISSFWGRSKTSFSSKFILKLATFCCRFFSISSLKFYHSF